MQTIIRDIHIKIQNFRTFFLNNEICKRSADKLYQNGNCEILYSYARMQMTMVYVCMFLWILLHRHINLIIKLAIRE